MSGILTSVGSFVWIGWVVGSEGGFCAGLCAFHSQFHLVAVFFLPKGPSVRWKHVNGSEFVMNKF